MMIQSRQRQAEEEVKGLRSLLSVAQVVVSSLELDEVLQNILCSAMGIVDAPAGSIALYDEESDRLTLHAHAGLSDAFVAKESWLVKPGGLTHRILDEGELFVVEDTAVAPFFNNHLALGEGIRSLIAVPLKFQEKMVGILYLDDFEPRRFPPERLQLLEILGSFATMSIDNARLHERTQLLARTDGLTGLYNHRQFKIMLRQHVALAGRSGRPLSLIMFDVDNFKLFNDRYGHPVGDKVLITIASLLESLSREEDMAFRYGGEEFVVILPDTPLKEALKVADRLRVTVAEESARRLRGTTEEGVTVSVGVASCPRDGSHPDLLLKAVDQLLYCAKRQGKNAVYHLPS